MTDEIVVSVKGLQNMGDEQGDEIEVLIPGSYCRRGDMHYIRYDEVIEGMEGSIRNLIKIRKDSMEVTKKGLTNTHMIFEEKKKNMTYYETPFGNLLVGIAATSIELREAENQIDVTVKYALEVNYEHLADCTIDLKVRPKAECHPAQWGA